MIPSSGGMPALQRVTPKFEILGIYAYDVIIIKGMNVVTPFSYINEDNIWTLPCGCKFGSRRRLHDKGWFNQSAPKPFITITV